MLAVDSMLTEIRINLTRFLNTSNPWSVHRKKVKNKRTTPWVTQHARHGQARNPDFVTEGGLNPK